MSRSASLHGGNPLNEFLDDLVMSPLEVRDKIEPPSSSGWPLVGNEGMNPHHDHGWGFIPSFPTKGQPELFFETNL